MASGASNQTGSSIDATASDQEVLDQLCDALGHPRRRTILSCLAHHRTSIALADLADEVAVQEHDTRLPEIPAETVKRIYLSLYHTHIPHLEDVGLVTYHQAQDVVRPRDDSTHVEFTRQAQQSTHAD